MCVYTCTVYMYLNFIQSWMWSEFLAMRTLESYSRLICHMTIEDVFSSSNVLYCLLLTSKLYQASQGYRNFLPLLNSRKLLQLLPYISTCVKYKCEMLNKVQKIVTSNFTDRKDGWVDSESVLFYNFWLLIKIKIKLCNDSAC